MGLHRANRQLLEHLVEQYKAQQVWDAYFQFVEHRHVFNALSLKQLTACARYESNDCATKHELFETHFTLPDGPAPILQRVAAAFVDTLPRQIIVDTVRGDGDCFFTSIYKQFAPFSTEPMLFHPRTLRENLMSYCLDHLDDFIEHAVKTWQTVYEADRSSPEWSFFRPYAHESNAVTIGKQMLRNEMFLDKNFFAEAFSMAVTVDYINEITHRRLMIILIDTESEPSPILGNTLPGDENLYILLLRDHEHYSSIAILDDNGNESRIFTRHALPKLHFTFLKHLVK